MQLFVRRDELMSPGRGGSDAGLVRTEENGRGQLGDAARRLNVLLLLAVSGLVWAWQTTALELPVRVAMGLGLDVAMVARGEALTVDSRSLAMSYPACCSGLSAVFESSGVGVGGVSSRFMSRVSEAAAGVSLGMVQASGDSGGVGGGIPIDPDANEKAWRREVIAIGLMFVMGIISTVLALLAVLILKKTDVSDGSGDESQTDREA